MLDTKEYALVLQNSLTKDHTITFGAHCTVKYSGRAESFLPDGDRIFIIKPDKTLIVHQPTGNNPVNYMKPGATHTVLFDGGIFVLKSENLDMKEYMTIELKRIYFFNSHKLEDSSAILLSGTEKDMAEMIYDRPELIEPGFKPLSMEEHTKYGFIDIFGYDDSNTLTVVECKRYTADLDAVTQLRRYVEKIKESKGLTFVRGILASPKISANAEKMLTDWGFEWKMVNPPKYHEEYDRKQKTLGEY